MHCLLTDTMLLQTTCLCHQCTYQVPVSTQLCTNPLQVTPIQQCEAASLNVDCFNCDVAYLLTGTCMPGLYAYQYTLTDSEGYSAVPVNVTVQIYEQVG